MVKGAVVLAVWNQRWVFIAAVLWTLQALGAPRPVHATSSRAVRARRDAAPATLSTTSVERRSGPHWGRGTLPPQFRHKRD
jgi:hypothetical protein